MIISNGEKKLKLEDADAMELRLRLMAARVEHRVAATAAWPGNKSAESQLSNVLAGRRWITKDALARLIQYIISQEKKRGIKRPKGGEQR